MTQYNTLNVKWSNSQLNKLNSRIKKSATVTFSLTQNVVGNSNDETNFPHKLLLSLRLQKTYANGSCIMNSINKEKSIPKALLDARYNLVNNKINIKYSS